MNRSLEVIHKVYPLATSQLKFHNAVFGRICAVHAAARYWLKNPTAELQCQISDDIPAIFYKRVLQYVITRHLWRRRVSDIQKNSLIKEKILQAMYMCSPPVSAKDVRYTNCNYYTHCAFCWYRKISGLYSELAAKLKTGDQLVSIVFGSSAGTLKALPGIEDVTKLNEQLEHLVSRRKTNWRCGFALTLPYYHKLRNSAIGQWYAVTRVFGIIEQGEWYVLDDKDLLYRDSIGARLTVTPATPEDLLRIMSEKFQYPVELLFDDLDVDTLHEYTWRAAFVNMHDIFKSETNRKVCPVRRYGTLRGQRKPLDEEKLDANDNGIYCGGGSTPETPDMGEPTGDPG